MFSGGTFPPSAAEPTRLRGSLADPDVSQKGENWSYAVSILPYRPVKGKRAERKILFLI
jgi:hypothetical protein